jgi:hypothetical protein
VRNRVEEWVQLLRSEPERWVLGNSAVGMFIFLLLAGVVHEPYRGLLTGAGLLCAVIFWTVFILGVAGL